MADPARCSILEPVRIVGHRWSPDVHEIKDFLARNRVQYEWLDLDRSEEARGLAGEVGREGLPILVFRDGSRLEAPTARELAEHLGLDVEPDAPFYDLVIIGAGPAGLSAAIYGASEGLRVAVVEGRAPGGQAAESARIENYLGFPDGLSGGDLTRRSMEQALRFGAEVLVTRTATRLRADGRYRLVTLDDETEIAAHAVLLATGVSYRWLEAPGCPALVGAGVYYGAASAEAEAFRGQDIYLLGGGNSAGQAAVHLARYARRVIMLVLEGSIEETMSEYLVARIRATPNIEVHTRCTVAEAAGEGHLESLRIEHVETGETERVAAHGLYVFIGGTPRTEWLDGIVALDEQGFVLSGGDAKRADGWRLERDPLPLETSCPGVFVAGDARHGGARRLATAVGEGAETITYVHRYREES